MPRPVVRNYPVAVTGGANQYSATSSLLDVTNGVTVILWARFTWMQGHNIWMFKDPISGNEGVRFNAEATGKLFTWQVNSSNVGSVGFKTNNTFPNREWLRLAVTYNGAGKAEIFVNGVSQGSGTGNIGRATNSFTIFPSANNSTSYADVRVYSRVLTSTEISRDYFFNKAPSSPSLVWKLDEGGGTTWYDTSGNGLHSIGNTPTWSMDSPMKSRGVIGDNLVYNGNFEYAPTFTAATTISSRWIDGTASGNTTGATSHWKTNISGTCSAMFDSSTSVSGKNSLKLSVTSTASFIEVHNTDSSSISAVRRTSIAVLPNTAYTCTYWMKTNYVSGSSTNGASVQVVQLTGDNGGVTTNVGTQIQTTTGWTQYTISFTTSATTRYADVIAKIYGHQGTGTLIMDAWFDDITLVPVPTIPRPIQRDVKSSMNFNGGSDGVIIGSSPASLKVTTLSFSAWIKSPLRAATQTIMYYNGGGYRMWLTSAGSIQFGAWPNAWSMASSADGLIQKNTWYHVVGTYNGTTQALKCYANGALVASATVANPVFTGTGSIQLGTQSGTNPYTGQMAEAIFYGTELTQAQITSLYRNYVQPTALATLKLNDGGGSTAYDTSGNGLHGAITGATYVLDAPQKLRTALNGNLVPNGDFSYTPPFAAAQTGNGWIDGTASGLTTTPPPIFRWRKYSSDASQTAQFDTTDKASGTASLKISNTGGLSTYNWVGTDRNVASSSPTVTTLKENGIPLKPSTSYTISCWAKADFTPAAGQIVFLMVLLTGNATISSQPSITVTPTATWQKFSATFTTLSTESWLVIVMKNGLLGVTANAGTIWFDDITLKPTATVKRTAA